MNQSQLEALKILACVSMRLTKFTHVLKSVLKDLINSRMTVSDVLATRTCGNTFQMEAKVSSQTVQQSE